MSFTIDKQTLEELNLLGKFRHQSIYHLFNQTKTRGGEQLLDQMFRQPLSDATAINQRSSVFQFFQDANLVFPFDSTQVMQMSEYIDGGVPGYRLASLLQLTWKKCLSSLTRDEQYRKIVQGLQATIQTVRRCHDFLISLPHLPPAFQQRVDTIREVLREPAIKRLYETNIYQSISIGDLARYHFLVKKTRNKEMRIILRLIDELDVFLAVSHVARSRGFSYAHALPAEDNVFECSSLYHPSLEKPIGNRMEMNQEKNVLFVTGANMAGKSTLMKSVGIAMYMAHMGFPIAGENLRFSIRDGLYSSINVADNIGLGYSHFYAEVVRVKRAAEAAASGARLLLIFDELFKGTNVKDAYDGTLAVTQGFAEYQNCLFIISTHILEVAEALQTSPNIRFVFMPTIMEGAKPRYTYRLADGITEDRQGMLIIRNEGILQLLEKSY